MKIGEYQVVEHPPVEGIPVVWISHESGEGGTFPIAEVEKVIAAYYKENF